MAVHYACSKTHLAFKKVTRLMAQQRTSATQSESNDCHAQHAAEKSSGGHHAMIGPTWNPENLAKAHNASLKQPAAAVQSA